MRFATDARAKTTACLATAGNAARERVQGTNRIRSSSASFMDALAHGLRRIVPQEPHAEGRQQAEGRKSDTAAYRCHVGCCADDDG
jgi:hypothetical protein